MLLLEPIHEARALVYLAEERGEDPEYVAAMFAEATIKEVKEVVRLAQQRGLSTESEWAEDFTSAHGWIVKNYALRERRTMQSRAMNGEGSSLA